MAESDWIKSVICAIFVVYFSPKACVSQVTCGGWKCLRFDGLNDDRVDLNGDWLSDPNMTECQDGMYHYTSYDHPGIHLCHCEDGANWIFTDILCNNTVGHMLARCWKARHNIQYCYESDWRIQNGSAGEYTAPYSVFVVRANVDCTTFAPTNAPSNSPTNAPSNSPTNAPSNSPTFVSLAPTNAPSLSPTQHPDDIHTIIKSISGKYQLYVGALSIFCLGSGALICVLCYRLKKKKKEREARDRYKPEVMLQEMANVYSSNKPKVGSSSSDWDSLPPHVNLQELPIATRGLPAPRISVLSDSVSSDDYSQQDWVKAWFMTTVDLPQYISVFLRNGYDSMKIISRINGVQQLEELGVTSEHHQRIILDAIKNIKPSDTVRSFGGSVSDVFGEGEHNNDTGIVTMEGVDDEHMDAYDGTGDDAAGYNQNENGYTINEDEWEDEPEDEPKEPTTIR